MAEHKRSVKIDTDTGRWCIALAMLFIASWDEPDLVDAVIHWLMKP